MIFANSNSSCAPNEIAYPLCKGRCMTGFFSCPNMCPNICIEQRKNCNKIADCPDKMDEFYKCRKLVASCTSATVQIKVSVETYT